jgi:hypothetical protein
MPEKPAPKPDDDTYSHEETVRRREATIRAMIAMKPKPHRATDKQSAKTKESKRKPASSRVAQPTD